MGPIMKASGSMINSMGMELNRGLMVQDTKVIMKMERKKDKADLHLPMAATTKENGVTGRPMVQGSSKIPEVQSTQGSGVTIKNPESEMRSG